MSGGTTVESWSGKDRRDENFPVGSLLLRRDLRAHVHAFYAFARNADDIADSAILTADEKIARLNVMEDVLIGRRDGGSPSAMRLRTSLGETGVSPRHSLDLLVAFRRDVTKLRYADWDELYDYCSYSAMPVGRHVLDLHDEDRATYIPSDALCTALQVLNHLQDCTKDLTTLDRCYLPGVSLDELRGAVASENLRLVLDGLLDRVDALCRVAVELPVITRSRRLRVETAVIVGLARRLSRRLRKDDPIARRVRLSKGDVMASVAAALRCLPR
jgi:farnesyl-diphosphate farnesyltransferase